MDEKRKNKRTELKSTVSLYKISKEESETITAELTDVSKNGIGFTSADKLLIGDCYKSTISLWTKDTIDAYLKIVRAEEVKENTYSYGAVFVGMMDNELMRIMIYQMFADANTQDM